MTRIKLCGLRRPDDADAANAARPDLVGFVFAEGRTRQIARTTAESIKERLDRRIGTVGVFVDQPPALTLALYNAGVIDYVQLHGHETEAYVRQLQHEDVPVIRALTVGPGRPLPETAADYLLVDSGPGGTGITFDWDLIRDLHRPFFLAGGLTPENVATAVKTVRPYGVDVSSGTETDGCKDPVKMVAFAKNVRAADSELNRQN